MAIDWEEELTRDAEALEVAIRREERRKRVLKGFEVEEVQRILANHPRAFARVIQARKKLVSILAGVGERVGEGTANYVIRHRQEGHVDEKLVTAYEALWIKTYGSGAGYIGDPNALVPQGAGGNQSKMSSSDERVYRGVAKGGGGGSGSRRSIIKDEKAFNFKRKMDKRMRRMAAEINEFMVSSKVAGVDIVEAGASAPCCSGCKRFIERGWRFCASCGVRCAIA